MKGIKINFIFLKIFLFTLILISTSCSDKVSSTTVASSGGGDGSSTVEGGLSSSLITGTLTLPDNTPATGAEVFILGYPNYKTTANASGAFEIAVPNALISSDLRSLKTTSSNKATIVVEKENNGNHYGLQKKEIDVTSTAELAIGTIAMSLTGHIQVTATLSGQTDHTGIDVYIPGTSYIGKTDSNGALTLSNIPAGTWNLRIEKDGYVYRDLNNVVVTSNETTEIGAVVLIIDIGVDGQIIINGGQGYSVDENLNITILHTTGATLYKLSESDSFLNADWRPIADAAIIELSNSSAGSYNVYVMFANANGLTSSPKSKTVSIMTITSSPSSGITSNDTTPTMSFSGIGSDTVGSTIGIYLDSACITAFGGTTITGLSVTVSNSDISNTVDGSKEFYYKTVGPNGISSDCNELNLNYYLYTDAPILNSSLVSGWTIPNITNGITSTSNAPIINGSYNSSVNGRFIVIYDDSGCSNLVGTATITSGIFSVSNISYLTNGTQNGTKIFYAKIYDQWENESSCTSLGMSYSFEALKWMWVNGSNTVNQVGVYGTKGVAHANNVPGARDGSASWIDSSNNLWLFGGDNDGMEGVSNDLWKFDGINWTWVSGSSSVVQAGVYGTRGVANANNVPGARRGSVSWIDSSDNLWPFGGFGRDSAGNEGMLNDLWKFDGTNWTWVSGSNTEYQAGVYGTKGISSQSNVPGARYARASWVAQSGNFYLFGGGEADDFWKFDGANWTWIGGSNIVNPDTVCGTRGISDSLNTPGWGNTSAFWIDSINNLYIFGGSGKDCVGSSGPLNSLWKFDGANWTWASGSNAVNQSGAYGTKGVADANNVPGARDGSVSWISSSDNLYLFGGNGSGVLLNDLWKFDGTNWTWISGSNTPNQAGVYGTGGVASANNIPGARQGSVSWIDSSGNLWPFGGSGRDSAGNVGVLNDLWKIEIGE